MVLVTANKSKRLLYLSFLGRVIAAEVHRSLEDATLLVTDLPDGFRLLTDLERLEAMDKDCAPGIGSMMDLFNQRGIELVVRVIPNPHKDIGLNILSVFHYARRLKTVTCENMGEALKVFKL